MFKKSIVIVLALLTAACVASQPYINPLPAETRDSIFIESVAVDMSELDQARASDVPLSEKEVEIRNISEASLKKQLNEMFEQSPSGADPANVVVRLSKLNTDKMEGQVDVIRKSDGSTLVTYDITAFPPRSGFMKLAQGKNSKINQVVEVFAERLNDLFFN